MKLKITLYNLKDYQKEYLKADLEYFKQSMKLEIIETLEKFKNDRSFWIKLFREISNRSLISKINYEASMTALEAISKIDLVKYSIEDKINKVVIDLYIDEAFFEIQKHLTIFRKFLGMSKKDFIKKLSKEINKTYHEVPVIEIIEE